MSFEADGQKTGVEPTQIPEREAPVPEGALPAPVTKESAQKEAPLLPDTPPQRYSSLLKRSTPGKGPGPGQSKLLNRLQNGYGNRYTGQVISGVREKEADKEETKKKTGEKAGEIKEEPGEKAPAESETTPDTPAVGEDGPQPAHASKPGEKGTPGKTVPEPPVPAGPGTKSGPGGAATGGAAGGEPGTAPKASAPATAAGAAGPGVDIDTTSTEGLIDSLASLPPSAMDKGLARATSAISKIQVKEKSDLKRSLPEIQRPTGLPRLNQRKKREPKDLEPGKAPQTEPSAGREAPPPETHHKESYGPIPGGALSTAVSEPKEEQGGSWWHRVYNRVRGFLSGLPTSDPNLSTSAGNRPKVDMTGDADPLQNTRQQESSNNQVDDDRQKSDQVSKEDFGENDIYPDVPDETLRSSHQLTPPEPVEKTAEAPEGLSAGDKLIFDKNTSPWLKSKTGKQQEKYRVEKAAYEQKSLETRAEGRMRIEMASANARNEQLNIQNQARGDVDGERKRLRLENKKILDKYKKLSKKERQKVDLKIKNKVKTTEKQADEKLSKAEKDAEAERKKAQAKAAAEKRKAKKKKRGWWSRVKGAVSSVFKALKSLVNKIFNALRKLVKKIIQAAKTIVKGMIEMARKAVVGFIKAFGTLLKGFVTIALAAYPRAAAKARKWIDRKVDKAVKTVNKIADKLKKAADAVLDFVGKVLDTALAIVQKVVNVILDVMKFLVVGLVEVMEKIGHLVTAARAMPPELEGAVWNQLLGVDISKPIPGERGYVPPGGTPAAVSVAANKKTESPAGGALTASDIVVEPVSNEPLEEELVEELNLKDGQSKIIGERSGAAYSLKSILADFQDNQSQVSAKSTGEKTADSTIAKSQNLEPSMSRSERAAKLWEQIKTFMINWLKKNWWKLLLGVVGALLGIVALSILTGGAILAALPIIFKIIAAVFAAVAIMKALGYLKTYLSEGWNNKIKPASIALANAIAVGIVELAMFLGFRVVGFGLKMAGKAVKAGVKTVARGVKATARAAKSGVTTAASGIKKLLKSGAKMASKSKSMFIRGGKLVFKGMKRGFLRGAKTVKNLVSKLFKKFRIKKIKVVRKGKWLKILGYINPWVLLADGSILQVEVKGGRPALGETVDVIGAAGKKKAGIIIGVADDAASNMVRKLKRLRKTKRQKLFKDLSKKSQEDVWRTLAPGKETAKNSKILRENMGRAVKKGEDAHHIVPSTHPKADIARKVLKKFNINVNDPKNGVGLTKDLHAGLHSTKYLNAINRELLKAVDRADALRILRRIARQIKNKSFP